MSRLSLGRFVAVFAFFGLGGLEAAHSLAATKPRPAARSQPKSPPRPVLVRAEGTLIDVFSGTPAANVAVRLESGSDMTIDAVSDAAGRVVFEGVAPGEYRVKYKHDTVYLLARKPGGSDLLTVEIPPADLGTLSVPVTAWAESTYGPLCKRKRKVQDLPRSAIVRFESGSDGWRLGYHDQGDIEAYWKHPWKGVVCVEKAYRTVGRYVAEDGTPAGEARQETIVVKVIRLDTGKEYKTKITAKPPEAITVGKFGGFGGYGDTDADLRKWIEQLPD